MGKKKSRTSRVSSGNTAKIRRARAEKRMTKFAAKREAGTAYTYKKNPFEKGTKEYERETRERANKTVGSKTPYAKWTSVMAKLDNFMEKEKALAAIAKARAIEKKKKKAD